MVLGAVWLGTRYSHPPDPPSSHPTPGTPPPHWYTVCMKRVLYTDWNMVVGLKSVAQLTLGSQISGFGGMTEVYNLVRIDRNNNHLFIPGND